MTALLLRPTSFREFPNGLHKTRGNSNKQIARQLKIEEITVALHLRSIYRKLSVASRTQAVRLALQLGR